MMMDQDYAAEFEAFCRATPSGSSPGANLMPEC